jgi:hypothetical protein
MQQRAVDIEEQGPIGHPFEWRLRQKFVLRHQGFGDIWVLHEPDNATAAASADAVTE